MGHALHEVEHRFLVDAEEASRFLAAVRPFLPLYLHDLSRPIELIRTTYYDTDELVLFRTQAEATSWRVRVRQYAAVHGLDEEPRLGSACAFEVKEVGETGRRKLRAVGAPDDVAGLLYGPPRAGDRDEHDGARGPRSILDHARRAIRTGALSPRLTTWFRRLTYAGSGARITIDQAIEFARPVGVGAPGTPAAPTEIIGHGPPLVLEVKLRVAPPGWLAIAMERLLVSTRFSKFRDGLLSLGLVDWVPPRAVTARGSGPFHEPAPHQLEAPIASGTEPGARVSEGLHPAGALHPGGAPSPRDVDAALDRVRQIFGLPGAGAHEASARPRVTTGR